jgi:hypothetical protein
MSVTSTCKLLALIWVWADDILSFFFLSRDRATAPGQYEYNTYYSQYIQKCTLSGRPGCDWCFHLSVKLNMCTNFVIRSWFSCGSRCQKYLALSPIHFCAGLPGQPLGHRDIWLEGVLVQLMHELQYKDQDNRALFYLISLSCSWGG